jgi:hypothetical protein
MFSLLQYSVGVSSNSFQYLTSWARLTLPHPKALNSETQKKLWEWCEDQIKETFSKESAAAAAA